MDDVQTLKLGGTEAQAPVTLTGIDKMGERLGRRVRAMMEPLVGIRPHVTVRSAEMVNFDLWSAMVPGFCSLSIYRLLPLKGSILVRQDPAMIASVVDRYYGGAGAVAAAQDRKEFTMAEERLLGRVADGLIACLTASWAEYVKLDSLLLGRETDPQGLNIAESTDQMMVQNIDIALEDGGDSWTVELMFPMVAVRQLEPLLNLSIADEAGKSDPLWRSRLAHAMQNVRLPARTVLARTSLNLEQLLALAPGDVIPVNIPSRLPLIVGHRVVAHGTIGEQHGHAALRIETLS